VTLIASHDIEMARELSLEVEMSAIVPPSAKQWFRTPHLVQLNLCVATVLLSSTTMGFDGSMMNGLQSLDTWFTYFGSPNGTWLGLMNAVLPLGVVITIHRQIGSER
jgi:hypothetical protein